MPKLTPHRRRRQARQLLGAQNRQNIAAPDPEGPRGLLLHPHPQLDDLCHELRQELGREPTPKEIRARFENRLPPIDLGQMLVDGVREMLGPLPENPPSRWRFLVQRLLHPWRAVPVTRPGHRS
jgi:hypothetical protein